MILVFALLLMQQIPRQRLPVPRQTPNPHAEAEDAVATFDGTFKSADKKRLLIEVENGQTMQMFVTGSTKFVRNGKPAKPGDFENGEAVTVDASRDARLNLIAVKVESAPKESAPKREERQPGK